ncbi:MAG: hypothetical protein ABI307_13715, partial [Mycobacterium sp.]
MSYHPSQGSDVPWGRDFTNHPTTELPPYSQPEGAYPQPDGAYPPPVGHYPPPAGPYGDPAASNVPESDDDLRVPGVRLRSDLRRNLGRGCVGPVLGLGS